ncbi:MAG: NAD(P)-dependent oxidoreductase [Bacteroidales bacterium]
MNVLFLDTSHPVLEQELEKAGFQCTFWNKVDPLAKAISSSSGLIVRSKIKIDRALIDAAPQLRFIGRIGAGMENIDVKYANSKGIQVFNSPEGNRDAVAEHALGMLLALMNHMLTADAEVRKAIWKREANRGTEIKDKTIGIIGFGNMGSAFAQRLNGFDCTIIAYDKYKKGFGNQLVAEVDYATIFQKSDILSLHVPLTDQTHHLVNNDYLNKFKKPIWIINTSRGPVVDTSAILSGIDKGLIRGAALDVLEFETYSFDKLHDLPDTFQKLVASPKVILSPHIAGWTFESKVKLSKYLAQKIVAAKNEGKLQE